MKLSHLFFPSSLGLAFALCPSPLLAVPAASSPYTSLTYVTWDKPDVTVDDCKSQGTSALAKAGMGDFSISSVAVFSSNKVYEAYVYCVFEKGVKIGVIGVAGPVVKESSRLRDIIEAAMLK
jgi:hypothetical protein